MKTQGLRRVLAAAFAIVLAGQMAVLPFTAAFATEEGGSTVAIAPDGEGTSSTPAASSDDGQASAAVGDITVLVSAEQDAALVDGAAFGISHFSQAKKGSNAELSDDAGDFAYYGYRYYVGADTGWLTAIGMPSGYAVVYVPAEAVAKYGIDLTNETDQALLKAYFIAMDKVVSDGGAFFSESDTWYFTSDNSFTVRGVTFGFDRETKKGSVYATVIGEDGSDISGSQKPTHCDMARVASPDEVDIVVAPTGLAAFAKFLRELNWSPLWVSLKTTLTAIVLIFILGLAAAYFTLHLSPRAQDIFDAIFTIPMVLPPTVCGFVLLFLCGSKTAFGRFFIDIGFPLIFSWPATVIAAVVVAFPLMYRNARGAFENLDANMLDAAKTLGWSNRRIFFRLMLPLSWSSIAAATVLAFARALGEFGATLFLAGNYLGVTRTIPIAIYFEWMNGNDNIAWFWTAIIIIFSFIVILFINLWSKRTTKYRRREVSDKEKAKAARREARAARKAGVAEPEGLWPMSGDGGKRKPRPAAASGSGTGE